MKKTSRKITKNLIAFGVVSSVTALTNIVSIYADSETEFNNIINKYQIENIIVENGISLNKGETLDLSKNPGWNLSNNDTVDMSNEGIVSPKNEGTVYLSKEIDGKIHIIEVFVTNNNFIDKSSHRNLIVGRNYYKVFIDPGHGGKDPGAVANSYNEDDINLAISKKIKNKLASKGIDVKMSRESDIYLTLKERINMANEYNGDVFISIHQNSSTSTGIYGVETYYQINKSSHKIYSQDIQNEIIKETNAKNRGIKTEDFAVTRETKMVSSLVECGFLTNKLEADKLGNPVYQDKIATGIANGIEKYLKENIKLKENDSSIDEIKPPSTSTSVVINKGTVTAETLNVRSGYGTSYSILGKLSKGTKVEIVESKNGWYKIKYNSGYGYVSGDYIKLDTTSTPVVINKGIVTAEILNVRSGYGTSYSVIGTLTKGSKVEIVESKDGWYKIKHNNGYGYISGKYVAMDTTTSTPVVINKGTVTAETLNVRSGYGTSYSSIGKLSKGAKVEIVESKNGWYKIKYNSGYGYVSGDYIKLDTTSTPVVINKGTVTVETLNVRSGYGTSYSILGKLSNGDKVEIVESKNGWYKIKYNSGYGYISGDYVKLDN